MTGNWTDFTQKTAGSTDLDQDRTHNGVNELGNITETSGTAWITPVHDKNGNMTTIPKPSSLANGLTAKYDAWNRLAEVKDGTTIIASYEYDGRNRRVKQHLDTQSPASPDGLDTYIHYFHNHSWQTLDTRPTRNPPTQTPIPLLPPLHRLPHPPRRKHRLEIGAQTGPGSACNWDPPGLWGLAARETLTRSRADAEA